jgi:hypothetical protein
MRFIQLFVEKEQRWRFWTIDALCEFNGIVGLEQKYQLDEKYRS